MKKAFALLFGAIVAGSLGGCPVYSSDRYERVCTSAQCYACRTSVYDSDCIDWRCDVKADCPNAFVCQDGRCVTDSSATRTCGRPDDCAPSETCGADQYCHAGTCRDWGCQPGYACGPDAMCRPSSPVDAGAPRCARDNDCGEGRCLSGRCVSLADVCSDSSQCKSGLSCVNGKCTPICNAGQPCPTGYACDTTRGVCSLNPLPCGAGTSCTGGTVCVTERCVAPCGPGGTCSAGLICVGGGCVPDEARQFDCNADGVQDRCASGSICLRRSCYLACSPDAGDACARADRFNVCKPVSVGATTHYVCGSNENLGTQCDVSQGRNCLTNQVCIDGFCR